MAKFIATGKATIEKDFKIELEASSKIAAKQQLTTMLQEEEATLKEVSFEEISEEVVVEETAINDGLPTESASTPTEDFTEKSEEKTEAFPMDLTDAKVEEYSEPKAEEESTEE